MQHKAAQQRQQDTGEEGRHCHRHLTQHGQRAIRPAARTGGGKQPHRQGNKNDHHKSDAGQQRRHAQFAVQQLGYRHGVNIRGTEISLYRMEHPLKVPGEKRTIQPQLRPHGGHRLGGGVAAQQLGGGVAGDHLKGQKGKERDDDHGQKHHSDFLGDVFHGHHLFLFLPLCPAAL